MNEKNIAKLRVGRRITKRCSGPARVATIACSTSNFSSARRVAGQRTLYVMPPKPSPTLSLAVLALTTILGCASGPLPRPGEPSAESLLNDERVASLGGPETSSFADVRSVFTAAEVQFMHEHIGDVERLVNLGLQSGNVSSAWIAGYFRIESSLPLLRQCLLTDRYFYGWEGPDPDKESSYLLDEQYTHHLAFIAAIEAITGRPLRQSVTLTPVELQMLKSEADVDFAKREAEPERVHRGLCARWLLGKLVSAASGGA